MEDRNDDGSDDRLLSLSTTRGIVPKQWDDEGQVRSGAELRKYWRVRPGHVVVNPMWVMNGAVAASEIEGVISPDYRVYQPAPDVSARFLHYLLHSREYMSLYGLLTRGSTTFDRRISKVDFHEIPTIVPPLVTQRAIADFLDRKTAAIDALIAKKERLIELLQEKRQALITQAVTKGLDESVPMKDSGIEWLGEIPAHWEVSKLGYEVTFSGGSTPSKDELGYWDGEIPWVSPKDMKRRVLCDSIDHVTARALAETSLKLIEPGSVLVVVRGMILAKTFPVAETAVPVTVNQDMKALRPRRGLHPSYLAWQLRARENEVATIIDVAGHGTRALRTDLFSSFQLLCPPSDEQLAIADSIHKEDVSVESQLMLITKSVDRLREYRQALITEAVTGKLDVTKEDAA